MAIDPAPNLGQVLSHHQRSSSYLSSLIVVLPAGFALFLGSSFGVLWVGGIVAGLFVAFGLYSAWDTLEHADDTLFVQAEGISGCHRRMPFDWPWNAVRLRRSHTLVQEMAGRTRVGEYTVNSYRLSSGNHSVGFDDAFISPEVLCSEIEAHMRRHQLEPLSRRVALGERLDFGALWLDRSAIGRNADTVSWSDVSGLEIENGVVTVAARVARPVLSVRFSKIDNAMLLFDLVKRLGAVRASAR